MSQSLLFLLLFGSNRLGFNSPNFTSARGRSEELLHYLFVPRGTCGDVGTCTEGKSIRFGLCILD